ncbi:MAG: DUF1428 domain-containing protein [Pseudomonadales bacterium]
MSYIDGMVAAVTTTRREEYRLHAQSFGGILREHGALEVVDCWGDDVPDGEVTSFPMAVKCGKDETVVFSWIRWPSRAARDAGTTRVMADPRAQTDMPFDGKRVIIGGFEVISES